jgi:hypothetical protein
VVNIKAKIINFGKNKDSSYIHVLPYVIRPPEVSVVSLICCKSQSETISDKKGLKIFQNFS